MAHGRKVLGYSVYFKDEKESEKFYKSLPDSFDAQLNKKEKEVTIIGIEPIKKEDFMYVFEMGDNKASVEPHKVMFVETLFERG